MPRDGGNRRVVFEIVNTLVENALELRQGLFVAARDCHQLQFNEDVAERGDDVLGLWGHIGRISDSYDAGWRSEDVRGGLPGARRE